MRTENAKGEPVLTGYWIVRTVNGRRFYAHARTQRENVIAYRECAKDGDDLWIAGKKDGALVFEERMTIATTADIASEREAVLNLRYERIESR